MMIKLNKNALLVATLILGTTAFSGCSGSTTTTTTANNTTNKTNTTVTTTTNNSAADNTTTKTETAKTEIASTDKIGVPECDDFLAKYEACVNNKVPEAARASFKSGMEQWRTSWKQLAANPQTKGSLAEACKKSLDSSKQSLSAYSCAW
jgi:hypothetical protein